MAAESDTSFPDTDSDYEEEEEKLTVEENCFEKYSDTSYLEQCKFYIEV